MSIYVSRERREAKATEEGTHFRRFLVDLLPLLEDDEAILVSSDDYGTGCRAWYQPFPDSQRSVNITLSHIGVNATVKVQLGFYTKEVKSFGLYSKGFLAHPEASVLETARSFIVAATKKAREARAAITLNEEIQAAGEAELGFPMFTRYPKPEGNPFEAVRATRDFNGALRYNVTVGSLSNLTAAQVRVLKMALEDCSIRNG